MPPFLFLPGSVCPATTVSNTTSLLHGRSSSFQTTLRHFDTSQTGLVAMYLVLQYC